MKSKIRIDLDQTNTPVIMVDYIESEDVRDKMVGRFIEGFGFNSNEAKIEFMITGNELSKQIMITPISKPFEHVLSNSDLANNPDLILEGHKEGDKIELP